MQLISTLNNFIRILLLYTASWTALYSQDVAWPMDLDLLLQKSRNSEIGVNVPDIVQRIGNAREYDLIVVVYGEFLHRAIVVGFKGIQTGVMHGDGKIDDESCLVYVPENPTQRPYDPHVKFIKKQRNKETYLNLAKMAWEMAKNAKFDMQRQLKMQEFVGSTNYLYFVNGRLFEPSSNHQLIGGYILAPEKGSKSFLFVEQLDKIIDDLNHDIDAIEKSWKNSSVGAEKVLEYILPP